MKSNLTGVDYGITLGGQVIFKLGGSKVANTAKVGLKLKRWPQHIDC